MNRPDVSDWIELLRVLRACQGICRQLAEEALMRIGTGAEGLGTAPDAPRQKWLIAEREKLAQLLEQLGEPL